jgi:prepilin-type N-terminal cleavage/methylation domain-containing protein
MHPHHRKRVGFTLVEISITVAVIGILAALCGPFVFRSITCCRCYRFAKEIRTAANAFEQYAMDHGFFPQDAGPAQLPVGMEGYLNRFSWEKETVIGGFWDWVAGGEGQGLGISVNSPSFSSKQIQQIDSLIDDGDLSTGLFRSHASGYIYMIEG